MTLYYIMAIILLIFSASVIIFLDVLIGLLGLALSLGVSLIKFHQTAIQLPHSIAFKRDGLILHYEQKEKSIQFKSVVRVHRLENVLTKKDTGLVLETESGKIQLTIDSKIADEFMKRYEDFKKSEVRNKSDKLFLTKVRNTDIKGTGGFVLAVLTMLSLIYVLWSNDWHVTSSAKTLLSSLSLIALSLFSFFRGRCLYIESKNEGKNAIKRFWKQYEGGKLPKLYHLEKNKYNGKAYIVFSFSGGLWHLYIDVYAPSRIVNKVLELLKNKEIKSIQEYEDGIMINLEDEVVKLSGEEKDVFLFLSCLLKTQKKRVEDLMNLLCSSEQEGIRRRP